MQKPLKALKLIEQRGQHEIIPCSIHSSKLQINFLAYLKSIDLMLEIMFDNHVVQYGDDGARPSCDLRSILFLSFTRLVKAEWIVKECLRGSNQDNKKCSFSFMRTPLDVLYDLLLLYI